ncbi:hypothetical protein FRX31_014422 [Thalictrum thalictroides]|uniref:Transmembrane protein n=1 Tax=Thalictrum thalictroides TaxID=46969 RepID=A0A7J6WEY7_THATH|nr:hypothetical protein FRX31_014422 [Thalictrum thalictroides]
MAWPPKSVFPGVGIGSISSTLVLPRKVSSIAIFIGGLALFLFLGSWLLISSPIGTTVQVYFLGANDIDNNNSIKTKPHEELTKIRSSELIVSPTDVKSNPGSVVNDTTLKENDTKGSNVVLSPSQLSSGASPSFLSQPPNASSKLDSGNEKQTGDGK